MICSYRNIIIAIAIIAIFIIVVIVAIAAIVAILTIDLITIIVIAFAITHDISKSHSRTNSFNEVQDAKADTHESNCRY